MSGSLSSFFPPPPSSSSPHFSPLHPEEQKNHCKVTQINNLTHCDTQLYKVQQCDTKQQCGTMRQNVTPSDTEWHKVTQTNTL